MVVICFVVMVVCSDGQSVDTCSPGGGYSVMMREDGDWIRIPHDASMDFGNTFSVELWIARFPDNDAYAENTWQNRNWQVVMGRRWNPVGETPYSSWQLGQNGGDNLLVWEITTDADIPDGAGGSNEHGSNSYDEPAVVFPGIWTHFAMTFDSGRLCIYYNGTLFDCDDVDGSPFRDPVNSDTYIGTRDNGWTFRAAYDDVRIWSTARSDEQVAEAWDRPLTEDEIEDPDLRLYYDFELSRVSNASVLDRSSSANHGFVDGSIYLWPPCGLGEEEEDEPLSASMIVLLFGGAVFGILVINALITHLSTPADRESVPRTARSVPTGTRQPGEPPAVLTAALTVGKGIQPVGSDASASTVTSGSSASSPPGSLGGGRGETPPPAYGARPSNPLQTIATAPARKTSNSIIGATARISMRLEGSPLSVSDSASNAVSAVAGTSQPPTVPAKPAKNATSPPPPAKPSKAPTLMAAPAPKPPSSSSSSTTPVLAAGPSGSSKATTSTTAATGAGTAALPSGSKRNRPAAHGVRAMSTSRTFTANELKIGTVVKAVNPVYGGFEEGTIKEILNKETYRVQFEEGVETVSRAGMRRPSN